MEEPGPKSKSFKNLFSHDQIISEAEQSTISPTLTDLDLDLDQDNDNDDGNENANDKQEDSIKSKIDGNGAPKRTDWDMFAEQDIDSNFDVSCTVHNKYLMRSISKKIELHNRFVNSLQSQWDKITILISSQFVCSFSPS